MEEKLYFQPADYGKRKKKKTTNINHVDPEKKEKSYKLRKLVFFLTLLLILFLIVLWLLRGKKTVSGNYPENVRNEAVTCNIDGTKISKISSIDSDKKHIRVNAIFKGKDELKTISLEYSLSYANENEAYGAEARSHAELNTALAASGYSPDKFENKFARYGSDLYISLFVNKTDLDEIAAPYFMIKLNEEHIIPQSLDEIIENYESQGFSCESTISE